MKYTFLNNRCFPEDDKIYNNISLNPKMRNGSKRISDNYYYPNNQNNITRLENGKLSYDRNKRKKPIASEFAYKYKQYNRENVNYLPNINPRINNDYYYYNYDIPTNDHLVFGLPLIIPKARKLKDFVFTPKNKGMKKNFSNFEQRYKPNDIIIINTPQNINSSAIDLDSSNMEKKKKTRFFLNKAMKKNKTEEYLNGNSIYNDKNKNNPRKKWWKLLRYFVEVYSFFSTLKKYKKRINLIREKEIDQREEKLFDEIYVIRNWILGVQGNDYWKNMLIFKDINTNFTEFDTAKTISKYSKEFIGFISDFIYNLQMKTNDIEQIPEKVQVIIYRYIKKKAYFPRQYLNLFHIKRLKFDFFGSCINNTLEESAMILCYFIISSISVQQIFLSIQYIFPELKPYENIFIAVKFISSILYYLERNAFVKKVKINNNYIDLFNYYRCYDLRNDLIDKENDINILLGITKSVNIIKYKDNLRYDNYFKLLVDDMVIDKFWENNFKIMKKISNSLYLWTMNLAILILDKYEKKLKNKYY